MTTLEAPREHAVPCAVCRRPTWRTDARCEDHRNPGWRDIAEQWGGTLAMIDARHDANDADVVDALRLAVEMLTVVAPRSRDARDVLEQIDWMLRRDDDQWQAALDVATTETAAAS